LADSKRRIRLKITAPNKTIEKELLGRYLTQKSLGCFSPVKPSESANTLETVSQDLFSLVDRFRENRQVTSPITFGVLLRVFKDQCDITRADAGPAEMSLKKPKKILSSSLQNPSDPNVSYDAHKNHGYKLQLMETYCTSSDEAIKEKNLLMITHVDVEPTHISDAHALIPALESTRDREPVTEAVLADYLYCSDENRKKAKEMGAEVIAPTMGTPKEDAITLADFSQNEREEIVA